MGNWAISLKTKQQEKEMPREQTYEKTHTYPEFMVRGVMRFCRTFDVSFSEVLNKCLNGSKMNFHPVSMSLI